jgi:hypothetical protein
LAYKQYKLFKTVAIPTLSYSSQSQIIRITEERILISVEIHFMQTAGYTLLEHKEHERTRELQIPQMTESTEQRINLKVQVYRITNRIFNKCVPKSTTDH